MPSKDFSVTGIHQFAPDRHAKPWPGHGQVVENIVGGVNPTDPQTNRRHTGLAVILPEQGLFQNLGQRIVAGISGQRQILVNRHWLGIEIDSIHRIAAGQDDSLWPARPLSRFEQIERALHANGQKRVAILLAGGQVDHGIAAADQIFDQAGVGDAPFDLFHSVDADRMTMAQREHSISGRPSRA